MSFSPEAELMLRAVRRGLATGSAEVVRGLPERQLDWSRLVQLARRNRVLPLVHRGLADCPGVPAPVRQDLTERVEWLRGKNLALAVELHRVLALFHAHGVRALSFKGPELACEAYGDLGLRPFGDLDLLIHPSDVARVETLLSAEGFRLEATCAWQRFFRNEAGVGLDVHWALGPRWMRSPAAFDEWWSTAREVPVAGISVPTLPVEDLVLVLGQALTKDCTAREQRLIQLCDLTAILARHQTVDGASLLERARRLDLHRMVLLHGLLAADLLGARLPGGFVAAARGEPVAKDLARQARSGFLREAGASRVEGATRAGPGVAGHRFLIRSQAGFGHRLGYLRTVLPELARLAVTPTERDREFLPMARSWRAAQYLVRPVRVLHRWVRTGYLILD